MISLALLFPDDRRAPWQGTCFLVLQRLFNAHMPVVSHTVIYAFYRINIEEWQMRSVPYYKELFLTAQTSEIILWGKIRLFITWNRNALLFSSLKSFVLSSALANWNIQSARFCLKISCSFILSLFCGGFFLLVCLFFPCLRTWQKLKGKIGSSDLSLLNCSISPSKNAQRKMDGKLQAGYKVLRVLQKWCSHLKGRLGEVSSFDILPRTSASAKLLKVTKVIADKHSGLFILERKRGITPLR